jgi:hypothetical protein
MYVLTEQLHADGDPNLPFKRYGKYLERNKDRFPASAFKLASGPLLNAADRHCPHDAWLEWARFEEPAKGKRRHIRHLSLRVRLLGAYHDRYLELFYPKVYSYAMTNPVASDGHFDWRYSELRLSKAGNVLHEIEWAGRPGAHATWLIEASDVRLRSLPLGAA